MLQIIKVVFVFASMSNAQLTSQSVREGDCGTTEPRLAPFINPLWFTRSRTYFIPLASQYAFRNYAEAFLNRPANNTSELGRMCIKVFVSGLTARTYAYNRVIDQTCRLTSRLLRTFIPGQLNCTVTRASGGTNIARLRDYIDNVVMTDNQSFAVHVGCVNGSRHYKVLTMLPEISPGLYTQIRDRIVSLGFDPNRLQRLNCNGERSADIL